ncbi:uncharacterized protein LOC144162767 isoform X2 [Haemaphysalis longicornis]
MGSFCLLQHLLKTHAIQRSYMSTVTFNHRIVTKEEHHAVVYAGSPAEDQPRLQIPPQHSQEQPAAHLPPQDFSQPPPDSSEPQPVPLKRDY